MRTTCVYKYQQPDCLVKMAFYPKLSFFCDGENLMEFIGVENGAISYIEAMK